MAEEIGARRRGEGVSEGGREKEAHLHKVKHRNETEREGAADIVKTQSLRSGTGGTCQPLVQLVTEELLLNHL